MATIAELLGPSLDALKQVQQNNDFMIGGATFAIITLYTNSLLMAIIAHSINNTLVLYFAHRIHITPKLKTTNSNI